MKRLTQAGLFDRARLAPIDSRDRALLARFQDALNQGRQQLADYYHRGGNATLSGQHQSGLIDQLLSCAWPAFIADTPDQPTPALLAVGGYGRRELCLESDIDLLVLLPHQTEKSTAERVENFVRFCWDMGLRVGHSACNLDECMRIAEDNLSVVTSLIDARLVYGERDLFEQFHARLGDRALWSPRQFFQAKLAEQQARHLRYGDTAYNLEPNIKESPGGLRDLHMIHWVANRCFGVRGFAELVEQGYLTATEYRSLVRGRNFLSRLRNGLHLITRRGEDRLLLNFQADLAQLLGYTERRGVLAVEQMMQHYYRTVKDIQLLNEITLQHFEENILNRHKPRARPLNPRFNRVGNHLEIAHPDLFCTEPSTMLEMFIVLQHNPELTGVRASTIRHLRENLKLIDARYRRHPDHRAMFLEIFRYQTGLTHALRRMNAYGVLGRFFPEFGKIVGQMQHSLFHIYTVDAHSLVVVRNLRRLMVPQYADEFPVLTKILSGLDSRERLYLAALCHDIGKDGTNDHSQRGEKIARALCRRLGMTEYDAGFVAWLVRNHLTMSWNAQKKDISDPRVINQFAQVVGDQERLDNLYLLTVADIRGTNPKVWNEWKGRLLSRLYTATSRRLRAGMGGDRAIAEHIAARKNAIRKIVGNAVPRARLDQLWEQLDEEYFLRNNPQTSAWHATQICNASLVDLPLVAIRDRDDIQAEQILVMAPESHRLLLRCTAAIDTLELGIMDARVHTTRGAMAVLVFIVATAQPVGEKAMAEQQRRMRHFLLNPPADYWPAARNLPRAVKQFRVPTKVSFTDHEQLGHTTMELVSQDRPGLLYLVARALVDCRIKLQSAKISTVGEKAEDTFLITDRDGMAVTDPQQRQQLESCIATYIARYD